MSKRYGRNQKRKANAEIEHLKVKCSNKNQLIMELSDLCGAHYREIWKLERVIENYKVGVKITNRIEEPQNG